MFTAMYDRGSVMPWASFFSKGLENLLQTRMNSVFFSLKTIQKSKSITKYAKLQSTHLNPQKKKMISQIMQRERHLSLWLQLCEFIE